MIDRGMKASCNPKTIEAQVNNGSLSKYISQTRRNINPAAIGRLTVVEYGFGLIVTTIKKIMGKRT